MKILRKDLLTRLESVTPGLSRKNDGVMEQSDCFAFFEGDVITFNDEVACRTGSPMGDEVAGAIPADPMLQLLRKLPDEELDVTVGDDGLIIKGRHRRSVIKMEAELQLPIADLHQPGEKWVKLHPDFCEACHLVASCAGSDESEFVLTCVHIHPRWVEATDRFQICRFPMKTRFRRPGLIRKDAIRHVSGLGMVECQDDEDWVHFRNASGLVMSCRRNADEYPKLDKFLEKQGSVAKLPKGLDESLDRCEVFSSENSDANLVRVYLTENRIKLVGRGPSGSHTEVRKVDYVGDDMRFTASPILLTEITKRSDECEIGVDWMKVTTDKFVYLTSTNVVDNE